MPQRTENLNVASLEVMPSPDEVKARVPLTEAAANTVVAGRRTLEAILDGNDPRLFLVVGPC
jgi:3-deoxy-7-phosphoheptulonate synthase